MAAGDGDVPGGNILASADARGVVLPRALTPPPEMTISLAALIPSMSCFVVQTPPPMPAPASPPLRVDIAAIDIDMAAASLKASADSGRKPAASGVYRAG